MTRAEKNVIGCLLLDPNEVGNTNLEPYMFTDELYRDIFTEILRAYENHKPITDTVIEQALLSDTRPSHFLRQEMAECIQSVSTVMEIRANAEIVRSEYLARRLGKYLDTIPDPARINEQIGEMLTNLEALRDRRDTSSIRASDMVDKFSDQYFRERPEGIQTGLEGLDETLGDLEPGDVIVIGARPSVGKSALVTQIASHIAKKGKRVGFYNLEMSDKQIYERLIARESGISMQRIRRAIAFTGQEEAMFKAGNATLKDMYKTLIVTTGAKKVSDIRAEARHMEYDVIIIDYMQLLIPEDRYKGNRTSEVAQMSRDLKALATELNIPVIALSQLNRISETKETKEPTMAELRESGAMEQDASVIILMWNLTEDREYKGLKVDKSRQGKVGKESLKFEGDRMRFIEEEYEWQEEPEPVFK